MEAAGKLVFNYFSYKTEKRHTVLHSRDNQPLSCPETFAGSTAVTKTEDARKPKRKKNKKENSRLQLPFSPQTKGKLNISDFTIAHYSHENNELRSICLKQLEVSYTIDAF